MKGYKHLTIVIKLGTSSIVDEKTHQPLLSNLSLIVETAVKLRTDGHRVVIVSSGAIGMGMWMMHVPRRPKHLPGIQALAAVGQCELISLWKRLFEHLGHRVGQILLTRTNIADRTQYQNAQNTIYELLNTGAIPIVNENDTIAVSEIKFGDNDTLSAITAAMIQADYLFLMTDVDCLYTTNPRTHSDAQTIEVVGDISEITADVSSSGSSLGTGGMSTKLVAARLATSAGVTTVITRSSKPGNVADIVEHVEQLKLLKLNSAVSVKLPPTPNETESFLSNSVHLSTSEGLPKPPLHTRFLPDPHPIRDRSFWILHGLAPHGTIFIDEGAHRALLDKAGLLPVGIVDVQGTFAQEEAVRLVVVKRLDGMPGSTTSVDLSTRTDNLNVTEHRPNPEAEVPPFLEKTNLIPVEVGRALVNYSATEISRIKGLQSMQIANVLGYADSEYIALRENISLLKSGSGARGKNTLVGGEGRR